MDAMAPVAAKPDAAAVVRSDAGATSQTELIVGSKRGLEAWQPDGSGKRMISRGVALRPRWIDATRVLVIVSRDSDLAKGARLERISLSDGKRSKVAKLPPFACKQPADAKPDSTQESQLDLAIQDPSDFVVDKGGQKACISLMDRNINMMTYALEVAIDLKKGKVERWLTAGGDTCIPPDGVELAESEAKLDCSAAERSPQSQVVAPPFPFTFTENGILKKGQGEEGDPVLKIPGYAPNEDATSPSGRWMVLSGDQEDGDYIHRSLVLLDREKGEVFPLRLSRTWPAPLRAGGKQKLPHIKTPIAKTSGAVGETDVRWLGTSTDSERLIIDDMVVKPGVFSFSVDGEIAR